MATTTIQQVKTGNDLGTLANGDMLLGERVAGTGGVVTITATGTGNVVLSTSPTLVTPAIGTPASGTLTNCTGLPISTGVSGLAANVATALATPSSANLAAAVTDETGSGSLVFATSPTLVTPLLGTPTSGTLTNCTGLPISTGVSGLAANVATALATPSSANLAAAVTDETGSGSLVFATSPTLVTPVLGAATATSINTAVITAPTTTVGSNIKLLEGTNNGTNTLTIQAPASTADVTATFQAVTGTVYVSGGTDIPLADGGTNASLTASNGGVVYSDASGMAILAATATANKLLMSGSNSAPTWSTPTFPNASATSRKIIVSDGTNWTASTETYAVPGTSGNVLTSNGTNWTSAVPTTATGFRVTLSGDQTVTSNVVTKIQGNTEAFDTGGMYDNATNYRYTPTKAGKYLIGGVVVGTTSGTGICNAFIYKNGAEVAKQFSFYNTGATLNTCVSTLIDMNGTTDYVELYGQVTGTTVVSGTNKTCFWGVWQEV